jgi:hypothetical protein
MEEATAMAATLVMPSHTGIKQIISTWRQRTGHLGQITIAN